MTHSRKHIVIVGPAHPLRGGLATYNERLARELQKDYQVTLLTFTLQYPNFLFPGESQYSNDPTPDDLHIDVALNSINPLNWLKVGKKYAKIAPDLIIFRYWMPFFAPCFGTFARQVKKNQHTRIIAITDNIFPHEKHFYDTPFSRYFLGCLDGAVTMSKKVLSDLKEHFPSTPAAQNCSYHPHPLYDNFGDKPAREEACQRLNLDPNKQYILFFGFIRKYKGLDWLLEAFFTTAKSLPNVNLLVAGEFYEDSQPYLDLIQNSGYSDRIHLHTHFIPNSAVADYFAVSSLVAQPYKSATQSGVSQIAYHFNTPMLITNVGGLAELVPHLQAGWVSEPNIDSISEGIVSLFSGGHLPVIESQLPELKKQFSWESMVKQLKEIGFR
jgi:glycosyltransferase involved in cell wall biosynthesis